MAKYKDGAKLFLILLILVFSPYQSFAFSINLIDPDYYKASTDELRVFGLSQKDALSFDGDPRGQACSYRHKDNDLSNRWCHALVSKMVGVALTQFGFSELTGALLSGLTFIPKEYLYDKNPSRADLVATEVPLYSSRDRATKLGLTVFGDGVSFFSFTRDF